MPEDVIGEWGSVVTSGIMVGDAITHIANRMLLPRLGDATDSPSRRPVVRPSGPQLLSSVMALRARWSELSVEKCLKILLGHPSTENWGISYWGLRP